MDSTHIVPSEADLLGAEQDKNHETELWAWRNLDGAKHEGAYLLPERHARIDFFGTNVYDPWILPDKQAAEPWANHKGEYGVDPYELYGEATMAKFSDALLKAGTSGADAKLIPYRGTYLSTVPDESWVFERIEDGLHAMRCRFVLGHQLKPGLATLAIVGVNPSTAQADARKLDPTMRNVAKFLESSTVYGSYVMLNLCPFCTPDPRKIPTNQTPLVQELLEKNLDAIDSMLTRWNVTDICAAWGNNVSVNASVRRMLLPQVARIDEIVRAHGCRWLCAGLTKRGYPIHPYAWYLHGDPTLEEFHLGRR